MRFRSQPNILIILSDQLRRQALSVYDDPNVATPHIDALARRGVRFEQACSTYPICVPFRFTFMTGEYAHTRKIPGIGYRMSPSERTLADEFNAANYDTVYIGKWHLDGSDARPGADGRAGKTPVPRAFQGRWETWYGFERRNAPFDTYFFKNDDPVPHPILGYQTDGLFDIGLQYLIDRDASRPFCMVISVEPPHDPFEAPESYMQRWAARDIALPDNFQVDDPAERALAIQNRRRYYAMVENLDWNMGRLASFLGESRLREETVVVFLSDHGELAGSHGVFEKQWPYEESIGIPFVVADPRIPNRAGTQLLDPVCTEDLFPTLLGLAGIAPRSSLPGIDLTPLIHGQIRHLDRAGILLEFVAEMRPDMPFYGEAWRGFRSGQYKYTIRGDNGGAPWQFFDLKDDPSERNNLIDAPQRQIDIARCHRFMLDRMRETGDHFMTLPAFGCDGLNVAG